MPDHDANSALLRIMGVPLIAYVCNAEEETITGRLTGGGTLPEVQESVLQQLARVTEQVTRASEVQNVPVSLLLDGLGIARAGGETSIANMLRVAAGGSVDILPADDRLTDLLQQMARDVFPVLLLPRDNEFPFRNMALSRPLFLHPLGNELQTAIVEDEGLRSLFPSDSDHSGRYGMTTRSTGAGGSVQLSMFPGLLIQDAWKRIEFFRFPRTLEVLVREVQISLHRVRAAIEGSEVNVETAIGFAGILPPEGMIIELGWGRLRRANDQDFAHLPSGLAGKLSHTAEDGTSTNIDYAGDLVLETSIPYKIRVTADDADEWPPSEWATIERRVEVLTLGGLLAFERWPRVALVPTWRIVFDPLAHGPLLSWSDPRGGPGLTPYALDEGQMALLTDWVRRVHDGRRRSIEVSIRRFISAVTQRKDPVDGLVDAAIVWENLFGTRQGEATLRISASLAWLLEDTPAKREARYGQIAKLYGVRSDVVHGNRFVPSEEAAEANRIAIEATAAALRVLFSARQDLLGLDGGGARSRQLLLGREAPLSSDNPS